jgi:hypothetical protein
MATLRRQIQLNENVVRSLMLKVDARIADALVTHALTGTGPVAEQRRAAKEAEAAPAVPAVPEIEVPPEAENDVPDKD